MFDWKHKSSVTNFIFLFHNLDHKPYCSRRQDCFLKVMSKNIANNAIMPTTNQPLFPLKGGHRNMVHQTQDQVIRIIQAILGYMQGS
jgi:hypothetical protein